MSQLTVGREEGGGVPSPAEEGRRPVSHCWVLVQLREGGDGKDEERTGHQMVLDVRSFGKDAVAPGVDVEKCQEFVQLEESGRAAWIEEPQLWSRLS